ncbi:hypothetical protein [Pseudaestuariivita atlantica]|uniref:Uncharacterized protein n=1 Tax=Pseudaestuariivita atlantica TaxID=1317121 RepID=A0A0L1JRW3_9RHOB|nr:hypothetical protein [Pseudaestuariivita atlantica]KNG94153.1 hypothetical protein ATO11_07940 [Pseudaestuariivita atlantica]
MRLILPILSALTLTATSAVAGDYAKPAQAGGQMLTHKYPSSHNFCPEGLQPVEMLGQIMCGVPNAGPYVDRSGAKRKKTKVVTRTQVTTTTRTVTTMQW